MDQKPKRVTAPVPIELYEPADFLEREPHGGFRPHDRDTRDGLSDRAAEDHPHDRYTHRLNPEQMHSRTRAVEPDERQRRDATLEDGASFVEPMRADIDDAVDW